MRQITFTLLRFTAPVTWRAGAGTDFVLALCEWGADGKSVLWLRTYDYIGQIVVVWFGKWHWCIPYPRRWRRS